MGQRLFPSGTPYASSLSEACRWADFPSLAPIDDGPHRPITFEPFGVVESNGASCALATSTAPRTGGRCWRRSSSATGTAGDGVVSAPRPRLPYWRSSFLDFSARSSRMMVVGLSDKLSIARHSQRTTDERINHKASSDNKCHMECKVYDNCAPHIYAGVHMQCVMREPVDEQPSNRQPY